MRRVRPLSCCRTPAPRRWQDGGRERRFRSPVERVAVSPAGLRTGWERDAGPQAGACSVLRAATGRLSGGLGRSRCPGHSTCARRGRPGRVWVRGVPRLRRRAQRSCRRSPAPWRARARPVFGTDRSGAGFTFFNAVVSCVSRGGKPPDLESSGCHPASPTAPSLGWLGVWAILGRVWTRAGLATARCPCGGAPSLDAVCRGDSASLLGSFPRPRAPCLASGAWFGLGVPLLSDAAVGEAVGSRGHALFPGSSVRGCVRGGSVWSSPWAPRLRDSRPTDSPAGYGCGALSI